MSQVRLDFLNWRPDQDEFENPLYVCSNALHRPEGWVAFRTQTAGAQSTNTSVGTTSSLVIKSVGTNDQKAICMLHNATAVGAGYQFQMSIGLLNSAYSLTGFYTTTALSGTCTTQYTLNRITAFDVCELNDKLFFVARAFGASSTVLSGQAGFNLTLNGYADI